MTAKSLQRVLDFPTARPVLTLVLLLAVCLGAGVAAAWRGPRTAFGVEQFVPSQDPAFRRYEELSEQFGRDDNTVFVFATREGWFTPDGAAQALAIQAALARDETVEEVLGIGSATLIRDEGAETYVGPVLTAERLAALDAVGLKRLGAYIGREPTYVGRLVSADLRTLAFAVRVRDEFYGGVHHPQIMAHVEGALAPFEEAGVTLAVTGGPATQIAYREFLREDTGRFVLLIGLLLALALGLTFRSVAGVVLPLGATGVALYLTVALQIAVGIPFNLLSSAVPVLVLIVGISDSIHLLTRYREELVDEAVPALALTRAVRATAHACLMTSITTSVGFFVLPATGIPILAHLGIVTGSGVVLAYLTSLTLIPACLALLPPPLPLPPTSPSAIVSRIGRAAMDRPRTTVVVLGLLITALFALGAPRLRVESRVVDDLPAESEVVRTRAAVEERMGGNYPLTFLIHPLPEAGQEPERYDPDILARLARFQARLPGLTEVSYVSGSLSAADYLSLGARSLGGSGLPQTRAELGQTELMLGEEALAETLDERGRFLRVQLRVYDRGTHATFAFLDAAKVAFAEEFGGRARLEVQGFTWLAHRTHHSVVENSMTSFTLDFVIVAFLVGLLFRSVRLTILAVIPNVFPLLCTLAFMGLVGIDLRISSAIVFSVVFGIAVDDTVHFLARYHEERQRGLAPREAVERTIATTGRAMLFMAFVLATGFAVLMLSAFNPNRVLGSLMAATLVTGIVGDLVLLPALLVLGDETPSEGEGAGVAGAVAGGGEEVAQSSQSSQREEEKKVEASASEGDEAQSSGDEA
ncbi:MAG: MMPL family transporter [Planctomycetes bacterium]|nr:MMPL family transporter [Planctomycetota bacterium]